MFLGLRAKVLVVRGATGVVANAWLWREGWSRPILLAYIKILF